MQSFRKLFAAIRQEPLMYGDHDRDIFEAAVLEIAHAIKRGRKPSSCSMLPGQNVQTWLREVFMEEHYGCRDMMGEACSIATACEEQAAYWFPTDPENHAIMRAIHICSQYMRPVRRHEDVRGDWQYQDAHALTNRKKKAAWLRRKNGSHYDDFDRERDYASLDSAAGDAPRVVRRVRKATPHHA
jgi:hypothetical protein